MLDRINQIFSDSIDSIVKTSDTMTGTIVDTALMMVNALINERKILVCGTGTGASDSQDFVMKLIHQYKLERPSLPAIALTENSSILTAINSIDSDKIFSRQISALGQSDDLLFVIASDENCDCLCDAIKTAQSKEMQIIILCSVHFQELREILMPDDIEITISEKSTARLQEMQRIILHGLCELIDEQLFGFDED